MKKLLIVIDMQNDFITGALGSSQAQAIVPFVKEKLEEYKDAGVLFTKDTHFENYLETQEGKNLPVPHCIKGTGGWEIIPEISQYANDIYEKKSFGDTDFPAYIAKYEPDEIELCGVCTDICVVSNALILKAYFPEMKISVDAKCCAGVSEESHKAALLTMKMCQIGVKND